MTSNKLTRELKKLADKEQAVHLQRFFKTAPGEYGYGDKFRGIKVPPIRNLVKQYYKDIEIDTAEELLHSAYHEDRLLGLLLMVAVFNKTDSKTLQKEIYRSYISNIEYINNWDLVDLSCHEIVGRFLLDKDRKDLYKLAKQGKGNSNTDQYQKIDLWANRIAIVSTYRFIKNDQFEDTMAIADILTDNKHDLIHKAVGWMLREMGKRCQKTEESFLKTRYQTMPRTMLRYAIEKFEEGKRQDYLKFRI